MKPKQNNTEPAMDKCMTPPYAINAIKKYLSYITHSKGINKRKHYNIWECCSGEGVLAQSLIDLGCFVTKSDIDNSGDLSAMKHDFLKEKPYSEHYDIIVTNPPYSLKYKFIERCYELQKPFALLMPVETLGAAQAQIQFAKYGCHVIFTRPRINFKMPNVGWLGSAQFPVAWFTWGLENVYSNDEGDFHHMTFEAYDYSGDYDYLEWKAKIDLARKEQKAIMEEQNRLDRIKEEERNIFYNDDYDENGGIVE